jgi:methionyl-tRNA synthetase
MGKTFYITTAIDYPSGKPHMGHAYEKICADIYARWHRLDSRDVFFLTGTDEHGQKIERCAKKENLTPKQYVDKMVPFFKTLVKSYNISSDKFIRTTDPKHKKYCQQILQKVFDKGDIYKGKYEGWYCIDCETYYTEKDLENGKCPTHKKKADWFEEEAYFFKMSKYQKKVENYIKKQSYIFPPSRQKFLLNRMKEGVKDLCVSRSNFNWGVKLPFDKKQCSYVWFDALLNYTSGVNTQNEKNFWPADIHVIGHDIMWHHSVIWLSMLFAAGIKPPKNLLVHGFIKGEGGLKMSKSLGNVIDPMEIIKEYPVDSVRYFLIREIPFGSDGNFSKNALRDRHNNELVNDLGNLQARTLSMVERYYGGKLPLAKKNELVKKLNLKKVQTYMDKYELHNALSEIWKFINECNRYINDKKPWVLGKNGNYKKLDVVMYNLAESLRMLSILLHPFMPETSEKMRVALGIKKQQTFKDLKFGKLGNNKIKRKGYLFTKIEEENKVVKKVAKEHKTTKGKTISTPEAGHYIPFKEWEKMKLRVGKITKVQPHPNADRLYVMMVDLGEGENDRQIVAGIKEHYKPKDLVGKLVVVFTNLQPTKIRDVESNGMLLAAEFEGKVVVLTPDEEINPGASIR